MKGFESVIEERIRAAVLRGDFDALPGRGRPLDLDDDLLVPVDIRVANRVLKNSGFVPPELSDLREFARLARQRVEATDDMARATAARRLQQLLITLESRGLSATTRGILDRYRQPLFEKIARCRE